MLDSFRSNVLNRFSNIYERTILLHGDLALSTYTLSFHDGNIPTQKHGSQRIENNYFKDFFTKMYFCHALSKLECQSMQEKSRVLFLNMFSHQHIYHCEKRTQFLINLKYI